MEKFSELHSRLAVCYSKMDYLKYFSLSDDERDEVCAKERQAAADFLKSDAMNFENILTNRINYLKGNSYLYLYFYLAEEQRVTSKPYKPRQDVNIQAYI